MNSEDITKVFVGNVPFDCKIDQFNNCFKDVEGFIRAELIIKQTLQSRGFGFIIIGATENSSAKQNAEKLMIRTDKHINGRSLRFTEYSANDRRNEHSKHNYIIINNIPTYITRKDIMDSLSTISIGRCFKQLDRTTGNEKNTAIIEFMNIEQYKKVLDNGKITIQVNGNSIELPVCPYKVQQNYKKQEKISKLELYRAFNAGRSMGVLEGIKIAKKQNI